MTSFGALIPLLVVVGGAILVLLLEAFIQRENRNYLAFISLAALAACAVLCASFWSDGYAYFDGMLSLDKVAVFLICVFLVTAAFVVLIGLKYSTQQNANYGETYGLLLLAVSGLMMMVSSTHLLVIFLGLEVLSISSYALTGLKRKDEKSGEAAIKYFLMGSFASAFLVFGLALLFGSVGSLEIPELVPLFRAGSSLPAMGVAGLALVIIGFAFKIALVPFHMWAPDVYEGAPTPITAFFMVGPKAAGFTVFLRLLIPVFAGESKPTAVYWLLWGISALTMLFGNLIALRQRNVKRLFAYSSIAHSGYILIAVLARDAASLVFYLAAYLFMIVGAFATLLALGRKGQEYTDLEDFAGIGFKYPWIGATLAVFLISLAGFPPTGGFLAKFYVFSAAVRQGQGLTALVIIAILTSLVSVFYYLRIIVYMYMREPSHALEIEMENPALFLVVFLCLYGVLQLGLFPANILVLIKQAVASLL
jgi:NADH-quinone oxidoreductase subunit N